MLTNNNIVVMGIRNKWSIAWGIARECLEHNANLILTYRGEREKEAIEKLIGDNYSRKAKLYKCDVAFDDQICELFDSIKRITEKFMGWYMLLLMPIQMIYTTLLLIQAERVSSMPWTLAPIH